MVRLVPAWVLSCLTGRPDNAAGACDLREGAQRPKEPADDALAVCVRFGCGADDI